jgi:hypothetical protein
VIGWLPFQATAVSTSTACRKLNICLHKLLKPTHDAERVVPAHHSAQACTIAWCSEALPRPLDDLLHLDYVLSAECKAPHAGCLIIGPGVTRFVVFAGDTSIDEARVLLNTACHSFMFPPSQTIEFVCRCAGRQLHKFWQLTASPLYPAIPALTEHYGRTMGTI